MPALAKVTVVFLAALLLLFENVTGAVLAQENDPNLPLVANYLRRIQLPDGGWSMYPGGAADFSPGRQPWGHERTWTQPRRGGGFRRPSGAAPIFGRVPLVRCAPAGLRSPGAKLCRRFAARWRRHPRELFIS